MKLSIVIPVHNAFEVTLEALKLLVKNNWTIPEIVVIDNGSHPTKLIEYLHRSATQPDWLDPNDNEVEYATLFGLDIKIVRNKVNNGVWDTFKQGYDHTTGDVIAYLHSDLFVHEMGYDKRILEAFQQDEKLGLVGFVGSDEWGRNGGRGGGTMSNFRGETVGGFIGSPASAHGREVHDLRAALQVDGCVMIMSRQAMKQVAFFDWPPHHFYDRILSLRMLKANLHVAVLGIACDHISGQTANTQQGWQDTAKAWCNAHGIQEMTAHNWDYTVYNVAEHQFLQELHEYMRDTQMIRALADHSVHLL